MADSDSLLKYPTDFNLQSVNLVTPLTNGVIDLIPFLVELNLFEDVFGSSISGQLLVSDALGLFSNFTMSGTEFIQIEFKKTKKDEQGYARTFRIYKVTPRGVSESVNYEVYSLHFCSEELLLSQQYRLSKSYKGKKISTIVEDILKNYLKVGTGNTKKLYINETYGVYDFVLPNKKIFETIHWLSTYALPKPGTGEGADIIFFENLQGYWLTSLQQLYTQSSYRTFKYNPKNITQDLNYNVSNVFSFEIMDMFDTLKGISAGTYSNRVISINPLLREKKVTDFNYDKYLAKAKVMNAGPVINNYKNRHNKALYDEPPKDMEAGALRLVTSNSGQKKAAFVSVNPSAVGEDANIERFMSHRPSQIALANYTRIKISVPGDPNLTVGKVVDFESVKMDPRTFSNAKEKENDPFYSGKYLITAVRHIIKNTTYITMLELCKDSHKKPLSGYDNSNAAMKELSKGTQE